MEWELRGVIPPSKEKKTKHLIRNRNADSKIKWNKTQKSIKKQNQTQNKINKNPRQDTKTFLINEDISIHPSKWSYRWLRLMELTKIFS